MTEKLTFNRLKEFNVARCEASFHKVDFWKPWQWTNAIAGECGEACNITKKMDRVWPSNEYKVNWNKPEDQRLDELKLRLADEIADIVIYADLLASSLGLRLEDLIINKFNSKSDEIGSIVKL